MSDLPARIVIVDDDPMIGNYLVSVAKSVDAEARFTSSAEEFLQMIDEWDPTHVIVDLVMPGMDGVELMRVLAERGTRAQVIITSGVGARVLDSAARGAREHGLPIAGVLSKPFRPDALRALLQCPDALARRGPNRSTGSWAWVPRESDLQRAIENDELVLHFQPKVGCADQELVGFEALVRWQHPEHGLVPPMAFVPLAEQCGLIVPMTHWVLDNAIAWLGGGLRSSVQGFPPSCRRRLTLAINVSARGLDDASLLERACALCAEHSVAPGRVIFELTETSAMDDPVRSIELLTRFRMKGFLLSIDDFGTGYSSMVQLVRLPFSEVKIDRSFVSTAMTSEESQAVIRSIVELARSLSLDTVAEGVEEQAALRWLHTIGCQSAQGYHIARPMPPDETIRWARAYAAMPSELSTAD